MAITGVARLERFFRRAASLDVDRADLRRFEVFIERKINDLLLVAQANAKANSRDVLQLHDLPIGAGLQECMHAFRVIDREVVDLEPILRSYKLNPQIDLASGEALTDELPMVAGGLGVALARTFKEIWPDLRNPQTKHWDTAFRLFDLLL